MADPLLNQLLEQGAAISQQLSDLAGTAAAAIERAARAAEAAREKVGSESEDVHQQMQELSARLEEAEGALEAAGEEATGRLGDLAERSADVQSRVTELLGTVRAGVEALETKRQELLDRLRDGTRTTGEDFSLLEERLRSLAEATESRLRECSSAIGDFQEAAVEVRDEVGEAKDRFLAALDEIEQAAREQTAAYVDAVGAGLQAQSDALVALANRMLRAHNEAVVAVRRKLAEEAKDYVGGAVQPLEDAMEALKDACADHEAELAAKVTDVQAEVTEALELIQALLPGLTHRVDQL